MQDKRLRFPHPIPLRMADGSRLASSAALRTKKPPAAGEGDGRYEVTGLAYNPLETMCFTRSTQRLL